MFERVDLMILGRPTQPALLEGNYSWIPTIFEVSFPTLSIPPLYQKSFKYSKEVFGRDCYYWILKALKQVALSLKVLNILEGYTIEIKKIEKVHIIINKCHSILRKVKGAWKDDLLKS